MHPVPYGLILYPQKYASSNRGCTLYACSRRGVVVFQPRRSIWIRLVVHPPQQPPNACTQLQARSLWDALGDGGLQPCPGPHLAGLLSVRLCELPAALLGDVCLSHHLSSKRRAVCWCIDSTDAFCHACTSCSTCIPVLNAALLLIIPPCCLRSPCCAMCAAHQQRAAHGAQTLCDRCCCTTAYVQRSFLLLSGASGWIAGAS